MKSKTAIRAGVTPINYKLPIVIIKRWFDDWHLETKWVGKYRRLILKLPNSKTRQKTFEYCEEDMIGKYEDLESILSSCFDQIQRDNGGYKK